MSHYDEIIQTSAEIESREIRGEAARKKTFLDYIALAITTFGVGYLPLAPGTWGSAVGVGIYLLFAQFESAVSDVNGWTEAQITSWVHAGNLIVFLLFILVGIWAANRSTILFNDKDPSQAVVDEVIGQLLTFLFVPFAISGWLVFVGFLLFRLFDIWKPYPIDSLQNLPAGLGVCADDILAGVYAGMCLSLIYAVSISLF